MMQPGSCFEIRERSGSDEQPHLVALCPLRRIELLDGTSLRAWPHTSS